MDPGARIMAALDVSELARQLRVGALRQTHPEWTDERVIAQLARERDGTGISRHQ